MAKYSAADKAEAIKVLRKHLKPGKQVYTIVRHVSRSGTSRDISFFVMCKGEPLHLDYNIAVALGWGLAKDSGVKVAGCGMDMGFHTLDCVASVLWPHNGKVRAAWKVRHAQGRNMLAPRYL